MNKNQKYNLTLSIEENEELNAAIDSLIRARVQNIIRQECDKSFDRTAEEEVKRLIEEKRRKISDTSMDYMVERAMRELCSDYDMKRLMTDAVQVYIRSNEKKVQGWFEARFDDYIRNKFDGVVQADLIGTIVSALLAKKE